MVHIDVDLLRGEGGPEQAAFAIGQRGHGEGHAGARAVNGQQVFFGGAVRENRFHGQEQAVKFGVLALGREVLKLRRFAGHVVDDDVGHHVDVLRQFTDALPVAQTGIDLGVVNRVKTRVGPIDFVKERQQVNPAKNPLQGAAQEFAQFIQRLTAKTVDISDQLNLVFHFLNWDRYQKEGAIIQSGEVV